MFSARRRIPTNRLYNKDFLEQLGRDFDEAGYDEITIKLPYNLVGTQEHEIPLEEFLRRERNYPSVILSAIDTDRDEVLKILFVNTSRKAHFFDDTFPSGHSESAEIYVQSHDPARVYALTGFFNNYFRNKGRSSRTALGTLMYFTALSALLAEIIGLMSGTGFLGALYPNIDAAVALDVLVTIVALFTLFRSYRTPTGLYVNPPPKTDLWSLANRALKGELMDNPLVSLAVTVVAGVLTAIILNLLGLP